MFVFCYCSQTIYIILIIICSANAANPANVVIMCQKELDCCMFNQKWYIKGKEKLFFCQIYSIQKISFFENERYIKNYVTFCIIYCYFICIRNTTKLSIFYPHIYIVSMKWKLISNAFLFISKTCCLT